MRLDEPAHAEQAPKKDVVFNGGPIDKIVLGPLVKANGEAGFGLKPSAANVSPVPEPQASIIAGLLRAYDNGTPDAYRAFVTTDATSTQGEGLIIQNCRAARPFRDIPFTEHCTTNTPFYEGGSDHSVRLEWIYKGQLYYLFVKFREGKIASIVTTRATPPSLPTGTRSVRMAEAPKIPDEAETRARWGSFAWTTENQKKGERDPRSLSQGARAIGVAAAARSRPAPRAGGGHADFS